MGEGDPPSRIFAINAPISQAQKDQLAEPRGVMGELRYFKKGDRLQIIIVPDRDAEDKTLCELSLLRETLDAILALRLRTALNLIAKVEKIDLWDALCFLTQLFLLLLDWRRAQHNDDSLIREQPLLPSASFEWDSLQQE